jgi:hypothetical protein
MTELPPAPGTQVNRMAIASLLCSSIGWLCIIGPILGVVFGFLALSQIKQTGHRGRGLAIAGILIGAILFTLITVAGIRNAGHHHAPSKSSSAAMVVAPQPISAILGAS